MRHPLRWSALLLGIALFALLCAVSWGAIKETVIAPLLVRLPADARTRVLPLLVPIRMPRELLHNDSQPAGIFSLPPLVTAVAPVTCVGDGKTGARVQVIYARGSDVASRYDAYLLNFQQYASDVDAIFMKSAAETGGVRHIRWVHDAACIPTVANVTLTPAGASDFNLMITELVNQGFNLNDHKYLVFMDAHFYCGIGDISFDDRPTLDNYNNVSIGFARVDNGCWSGLIAAHELMHTMGAVQLSAPHSSGESHCTDIDDLMCRPTNGTPTVQTCVYVYNERADCNHDDYFSTVASDPYLSVHWNTANAQWFVEASRPVPTPTPCFRGNSGKPCK